MLPVTWINFIGSFAGGFQRRTFSGCRANRLHRSEYSCSMGSPVPATNTQRSQCHARTSQDCVFAHWRPAGFQWKTWCGFRPQPSCSLESLERGDDHSAHIGRILRRTCFHPEWNAVILCVKDAIFHIAMYPACQHRMALIQAKLVPKLQQLEWGCFWCALLLGFCDVLRHNLP